MKLSPALALTIVALQAAACGELRSADASVPATDTGMIFMLTPGERSELTRRAESGDAEAAYRLAQYYSIAGGEDGRVSNTDEERRLERHWLELAAHQGHEVAKFHLAIDTARDNCPAAREVMERMVGAASSADLRVSAEDWLKDPRFQCSP